MKKILSIVIAISIVIFLSAVGVAIFFQTEKGQKLYEKLCKREIEKNSTNNVEFPVYIGWNGYGFRTDIIEQKFDKLQKHWDIVFFENVYNHLPDAIGYRFRIRYPKTPKMSKRHLEHLVMNISEEVLTHHFQEFGVYLPVDKFIAVRIHEDVLDIAIAKNTLGFARIENLRRQANSD